MRLADRLHAALHAVPGAPPELIVGDDHDLAPGTLVTPAAVLIAITDRAAPGVLLTQRTETLRRHPGQIAFPGGRIDPEDDGPVAAALREAEEEIALPAGRVQVIGTADRYHTITGYQVTPVLGVVPPDLPLVPAEAEVAAVFEVPLAFLLDPANQRAAQAEVRGTVRHYYEILWGERRIWGATAAMLVNLGRRLQWR